MKIMVVMGEYPAEEAERRRQAVLKCASPGTEVGFAVIRATFFRRSNSQVNSLSAGPLVAEVAVHDRPGDPRAFGDLLQRRRVIAVLRKQIVSAIQDSLPDDFLLDLNHDKKTR